MKKLISGLLALTFVLSMPITAFAEDKSINQSTDIQSGNTNVSFNVAPSYAVTIPENITLDEKKDGDIITYEKDMAITADAGVRLVEGKKIQVTIDSDFTLSAGTTDLAYTVNGANTNNAVVAEFTTNVSAQTSALHFVAQSPEFAGNYTDTATFHIAVV